MLKLNANVKNYSIFWKVLPAIFIVIALSIFFGLGIDKYVSFQSLQTNEEHLLNYVADSWVLAALSYISIYVLATSVSIPFGAFLTLTGGFLFGPIYGSLFTIIAANFGAIIIFSLAKTTLGKLLWDSVESKLTDLKLEGVIQQLQKNALLFILFIRLVPIIPFYIANLLPAFTGVRARVFILGTFLGIIPGTIIYSVIGFELREMFNNQEKISFDDLIGDTSFYALVLLDVFSVLPIVYKIFARINIKLR